MLISLPQPSNTAYQPLLDMELKRSIIIPRKNVSGITISTILPAACTAHYTDTDDLFILLLLILLHEAIPAISIHYRLSKHLSGTRELVMGCYRSTSKL